MKKVGGGVQNPRFSWVWHQGHSVGGDFLPLVQMGFSSQGNLRAELPRVFWVSQGRLMELSRSGRVRKLSTLQPAPLCFSLSCTQNLL